MANKQIIIERRLSGKRGKRGRRGKRGKSNFMVH